jgi:hypothetical protein
MPTSESFQQLALRFTDPMQHHYVVIRGILLADATIAARSARSVKLQLCALCVTKPAASKLTPVPETCTGPWRHPR